MQLSPTSPPLALQPDAAPRPRTLGARQDIHVITQTIVRPSTTIITTVTLGGPATSSSNDGSSPPPATDIYGKSSTLTNGQIGGITGGVIAFVILFLLIWRCISQAPRQRRSYYDHSYYYYYDSNVPSQGHDPWVKKEGRAKDQRGGQARDPRAGQGRRGYQRPPAFIPVPQPPRPTFQVNAHPPWQPSFSGPTRTPYP